jgi:hypothetical protein
VGKKGFSMHSLVDARRTTIVLTSLANVGDSKFARISVFFPSSLTLAKSAKSMSSSIFPDITLTLLNLRRTVSRGTGRREERKYEFLHDSDSSKSKQDSAKVPECVCPDRCIIQECYPVSASLCSDPVDPSKTETKTQYEHYGPHEQYPVFPFESKYKVS